MGCCPGSLFGFVCLHPAEEFPQVSCLPSKDNEGSYGGVGFRSSDFVQGQHYDMKEYFG
jgi:hypothetical protein